MHFRKTFVYHDGQFHENSAVVTLVSTELPFAVFKSQHFVPGDVKFVVTEADVEKRIVRELNGAPAGEEYARAIGLEVGELNPTVFSQHPVVVRVGGSDYVRAIAQLNDDGSLTFFCAIDEGIVLTLATSVDLVQSLEETLEKLQEGLGKPQLVIGSDCILRRLEIEHENLFDSVDKVIKENAIVGFSTYGEQFNAMHVSQSFTGVAIGFAPKEDD